METSAQNEAMVECGKSNAFTDHHGNLDLFVEECNAELRDRGFHACEAQVVADWHGRAKLAVACATGAKNQSGGAVFIEAGGYLPLPWMNAEPPSLQDLLDEALKTADQAFVDICAQHKVLRLSFPAFARMQSRNIQVATEEPILARP